VIPPTAERNGNEEGEAAADTPEEEESAPSPLGDEGIVDTLIQCIKCWVLN
jgi:hypothetical protein